MAAERRYGRLGLVSLIAIGLAGCGVEKNSMVAPSGVTMEVAPPPALVVVNTTAPLSINLTGPGGAPVQDGTEVWLSASRGELDQQKVRAQGGKASVMFRAPGESGPVQITATSGEAHGQLELSVASAPVAKMTLAAAPAFLPPAGGSIDIVATALAPDGRPVSGAPVRFQATTGSVSPATAVTDSQGQARTKLQSSAATKVAAVIQGAQSADLSVDLMPVLKVSIAPDVPRPNQTVTFSITLDTAGVSGDLSMNFGDGATKSLGKLTGKGTAQTTHVYSQAGGYNATAILKLGQGAEVRETIRVRVDSQNAPSPSPAPPITGPNPIDANLPFSLSEVTWLHTNVSGWAVTSRITSVRIDDPGVCIAHTKSGRWPVKNGVEGNPWVFAQVNGRWYAATYEWLRPGQVCKNVSSKDIGQHTKQHPLVNWRPKSGELVGFMVSAHARFGRESVAERSNIVMVRWP
ncbi:MAG TPA: Ig-like domain-containing protein [Vicinamibacterales bacterium]